MARLARVVVPGMPDAQPRASGGAVDQRGERGEVEEWRRLREHERTGRPLGDEEFVVRLEKDLGRVLHRQKRGPKPKRRRN